MMVFLKLPVLGYSQSMYTEFGCLKLKEPRKDMNLKTSLHYYHNKSDYGISEH